MTHPGQSAPHNQYPADYDPYAGTMPPAEAGPADNMGRRGFLRLLGAGAVVLGAAGCGLKDYTKAATAPVGENPEWAEVGEIKDAYLDANEHARRGTDEIINTLREASSQGETGFTDNGTELVLGNVNYWNENNGDRIRVILEPRGTMRAIWTYFSGGQLQKGVYFDLDLKHDSPGWKALSDHLVMTGDNDDPVRHETTAYYMQAAVSQVGHVSVRRMGFTPRETGENITRITNPAEDTNQYPYDDPATPPVLTPVYDDYNGDGRLDKGRHPGAYDENFAALKLNGNVVDAGDGPAVTDLGDRLLKELENMKQARDDRRRRRRADAYDQLDDEGYGSPDGKQGSGDGGGPAVGDCVDMGGKNLVCEGEPGYPYDK